MIADQELDDSFWEREAVRVLTKLRDMGSKATPAQLLGGVTDASSMSRQAIAWAEHRGLVYYSYGSWKLSTMGAGFLKRVA